MKINSIKEYRRVMENIELSEESKQRITKKCATYSTIHKIKLGKYTITAVKKNKTSDRV